MSERDGNLFGFEDVIDDLNAFSVDIDGFEGPLHTLLELARRQKVDLLHVSILELATQYLEFVEDAREKRIDLAAEYLLMAAWLAFLKSKLLLPKPATNHDNQEDGDEMAARLSFRLRRLDAMRVAAKALVARPRLGLKVFVRGAPVQPKVLKTTEYNTSLYHLMQAFGDIRQRQVKVAPHKMEPQSVLALESARDGLRRIIRHLDEWARLDELDGKISSLDKTIPPESVRASCFAAVLELARDGDVDVRQDRHFAPVYLRGNSEPSHREDLI